MPSARSSASEPVDTAPTETAARSFIFMTAPLPKFRLWDYLLDRTSNHRLFGVGYGSFFSDPANMAPFNTATGLNLDAAHSSYMEVLIGTGIIGLALMAILLVLCLSLAAKYLWAQPSLTNSWLLAAVTFCLIGNATESMIVYNSPVWLLMVAAGFNAASRLSDPPEYSPQAPGSEQTPSVRAHEAAARA